MDYMLVSFEISPISDFPAVSCTKSCEEFFALPLVSHPYNLGIVHSEIDPSRYNSLVFNMVQVSAFIDVCLLWKCKNVKFGPHTNERIPFFQMWVFSMSSSLFSRLWLEPFDRMLAETLIKLSSLVDQLEKEYSRVLLVVS